jgi:membrane protein DedA with SNARE-associated domain
MLDQIIAPLISLITYSIDNYDYWGIGFLMALESANIPIPSEVILPYGGFLASQGSLNIHWAAFAGAVGCLAGSILSYYLGLWLGRPFLWKYGKWLLISQKDILTAEKFLARFGDLTFFITRLLPVVRTFVSFVIGVGKGHFLKFSFYTFVGSWIWSYLLVYVGLKLGDNWGILRSWWHKFDAVIVILIVAAVIFHIVRVFRDSRDTALSKVDTE